MIAITGPPPCGPWCMASTDTNTAGSPIATANAADRRLGVAMMVHVGIVEHDLPAAAQRAPAIGFAFDEAVHQAAIEVRGARTVGKLEPGIADRRIDAIQIESIAHHCVTDAEAAAGAGLIAE